MVLQLCSASLTPGRFLGRHACVYIAKHTTPFTRTNTRYTIPTMYAAPKKNSMHVWIPAFRNKWVMTMTLVWRTSWGENGMSKSLWFVQAVSSQTCLITAVEHAPFEGTPHNTTNAFFKHSWWKARWGSFLACLVAPSVRAAGQQVLLLG